MLLPFFLIPLSLFSQDPIDPDFNHACPPKKANCKEFWDTVIIDMGPLAAQFNITLNNCKIEYYYKYRVCFSLTSTSFDLTRSDEEEYRFVDPVDSTCLQFMDALDLTDVVNAIRFDIYVSEACIQNTVSKRFSKNILNYDDYLCSSPKKYITGRYYYGPCMTSCIGRLKKPKNLEIPIPKSLSIIRLNANCGGACCFAEQKFCIEKINGQNVLKQDGPTRFESAGEPVCDTTIIAICPETSLYKWTIIPCYSVCNARPDFKLLPPLTFNLPNEVLYDSIVSL